MKRILFVLIYVSFVWAQTYPSTYAQLGTPLFQELKNFSAMSELPLFSTHRALIKSYESNAKAAIEHGRRIDAQHPINKADGKSYLNELRALQKSYNRIEKVYKQQLYKSIHDDNASAFYAITKISLPLINSDSKLKENVVNYYKKTKKSKIALLEILVEDLKVDLKSYAYVDAMFTTQQKDKEVQQRQSLHDFFPDANRAQPVEVVMLRVKDGFDLYLENHAFYDTTITLQALQLLNLSSSEKLPYSGSFSAQSRTKFLHLSIINPAEKSLVQTSYNTYIGRLTPHYDKEYLYALPYERSQAFMLTQGFNGKMTHKGTSAYALDFQMPIGTNICAMRDGIVVALESEHTENGFSPAYANKANYIVIEHNDGTMAMYAHLKPHGVKVKLGQKVSKHQLIGLSGNTGYSSGPHLHVHISAIKDLNSGSSSVPFKFLTLQGAVSTPETNVYYTSK